jgi:hypothetical protein
MSFSFDRDWSTTRGYVAISVANDGLVSFFAVLKLFMLASVTV